MLGLVSLCVLFLMITQWGLNLLRAVGSGVTLERIQEIEGIRNPQAWEYGAWIAGMILWIGGLYGAVITLVQLLQ